MCQVGLVKDKFKRVTALREWGVHIDTVLYQINVCVWHARKIKKDKMHLKGCSLLIASNINMQ